MAPTLDDAWGKVEWAYRQLTDLTDLIEPFIGNKPYLVRDEPNAEGTHRVVTADNPKPVPDDVPFLFGDLIHSLHSALDYVVCSAVEMRGQTVTTAHAFPIFPTKTAYNDKVGQMLRGVPDQLVKVIESLQPYHEAERAEREGHPPEIATARAERVPLMRLYRLSIEEKHRALLVATAVFSSVGMYVWSDRTDEEGTGIGFSFSPSYDQAVVTYPINPDKPDDRLDPHFAAQVTLVKEGPRGMPVESLARMLYNEVAHNVMAKVRQVPLLALTNPRELPFPPIR